MERFRSRFQREFWLRDRQAQNEVCGFSITPRAVVQVPCEGGYDYQPAIHAFGRANSSNKLVCEKDFKQLVSAVAARHSTARTAPQLLTCGPAWVEQLSTGTKCTPIARKKLALHLLLHLMPARRFCRNFHAH
jgi:hypothetical protein